jgi:hypothetical protein
MATFVIALILPFDMGRCGLLVQLPFWVLDTIASGWYTHHMALATCACLADRRIGEE